MTQVQTVRIAEAKGRPMLHWVGKRPLARVTAFPAQLVETSNPTGEELPSPEFGGGAFCSTATTRTCWPGCWPTATGAK